MSYFSGGPPANEKLALAKRLRFVANLTLNSAATASLSSISSPGTSAAVGMVFTSGAGTLIPTYTFASLQGVGANPIYGIEVLDPLAKEFIGVSGVVLATTGAGNATAGLTIYTSGTWTVGASAATAATGLAGNITIGFPVVITNLVQTFSAASGTATLLIEVVYT